MIDPTAALAFFVIFILIVGELRYRQWHRRHYPEQRIPDVDLRLKYYRHSDMEGTSA